MPRTFCALAALALPTTHAELRDPVTPRIFCALALVLAESVRGLALARERGLQRRMGAPPAASGTVPASMTRLFVHASLGLAALAGCSTSSQSPAPPTPTLEAPQPPLSVSPRIAPASSPAASGATAPPVASSRAPAVASSAPPAAPPEGMALVPAGPFIMGQDELGELDERPAHEVTLRAFYLDLTEVTNEAYSSCVKAGVCRPHDTASARANKVGDDASFRRPRQPISSVSHDDARAFCNWVGKRLPTEAEWEKAARGAEGRLYPWGSAYPTQKLAVFGEATTADVGSRPDGRGPYGHYDLAGNVWEWVDDLYDPYAYRRPTADKGIPGSCDEILAAQDELRREKKQGFTGTNPIPTECEYGLRGGAFQYFAKGLRASNRVHHPGRFRLIMSGFRCAKDAE